MNLAVAKGDMAEQTPEPQKDSGNLRLRIFSALILALPFVIATYYGRPWFDLFVWSMGVLMTWEWSKIALGEEKDLVGRFAIGVVVAVLTGYYFSPLLAVVFAAVGAGIFGIAGRRSMGSRLIWLAIGIAIIGIFCLSFLWIRDFPESGQTLMIWLIFAIWFTDTGGYFFGRSIGGPKLAPTISPNKTWMGLAGGVLLAAMWSAIWLSEISGIAIGVSVGAGIVMAILAQIGDLGVSKFKRRFGVKDSSALIPGHGGVLDRTDGMLLTAPALAILLILAGESWIK